MPVRYLIAALIFVAPVQATAGPTARIALSEVDSDRWRVAYSTDSPVEALRLVRNPDLSRLADWRADDRAFEIVREGEADVVRRRDGASFREARFTVPARYAPLPKDYASFSPFTDGGLLIYSGRFHACAGPDDCAPETTGEAPTWRIAVTAPKGARIIVAGRAHRRAVEFLDIENGTYIYVGRARPIESSHVIGVIDAGFPADARDMLATLLPKLLDHFTGKFGPLDSKPMLYASLDRHPRSGSGFNYQGGVLPDQIFVHFYGEKWAHGAGDKLAGMLPWFFAHEAAHLFQRIGARANMPMEQSWVHEGGAEALAALAVDELDAAAPGYVEKRIDEACEDCAQGLRKLDGKPLNASAKAGAFGNYYACGLVMHIAIDREVRAASGGEKSLYDVWALFLERVSDGANWDQETFLAAARSLGAEHSTAFAQAIAAEPLSDPAAFLAAGLAAF